MTNYEAFRERIDAVWKEYSCPEELRPKLEWSMRLTRASGKFKCFLSRKECRIILNHKALMAYGAERMMSTLNHELAHAILWAKHGYMGHGIRFKVLCSKLGGTMNTQMAGLAYKECADTRYLPRKSWAIYKCPCGAVIKRGRFYSYQQENDLVCIKCDRPLTSCGKFRERG
jgi:predicted SprT family Zn-dependent metalloprotease